MKEKPGAQTPWNKINQLLALDERFAVDFSHWQGFLLAPKHVPQLAALLYLLNQEEIKFIVQGRGTSSLLTNECSVIVSARAFSQIIWHEQGVVEVGAGCSLLNLNQFLFERNQEIALEGDPLASSKCSVAGLILSGRISGICYREEFFLETLLGVDFVTWEGSQIKWGSPHRSASVGPVLHKLIGGFHSFPGIITKVILKSYPIPQGRLRLAWAFHQKEKLWKQFHDLQQFSSSWDYLDLVLSGQPKDQGFIFAQISGLPEEMQVFSEICPGYEMANQQEEKLKIKNFLSQQKLKAYFVSKDYSLKPGEYLWIQSWNEKAWLLADRMDEKEDMDLPIWKQRFRLACK